MIFHIGLGAGISGYEDWKYKKVYIAGKISGDERYHKKFAFIKEFFESNRKIVLCPADLPQGLTNAEYMKIDMAMIDAADAVFFLPDYKESKGATLEKQYCEYIQKNHAVISIGLNGVMSFTEYKRYDKH